MIENNTTVFEIFTGDDEMYGRLSRALALWSEAMCLRLKILRGKVSAPACGTSDLVIIDMSSDDRFLPAQPCDGCAVLAVARGDEQCMRAYRRHPLSRLGPDFDWDSLCAALGRCFEAWYKGLASLSVPKLASFPLCQLQYAEASGRRSIIHGTFDTLIVSVPFGALAERLPSPPFIRCQRSYIVNLSAAVSLHSGQLELRSGTFIPVSRAGTDTVRRQLLQWQQCRKAPL